MNRSLCRSFLHIPLHLRTVPVVALGCLYACLLTLPAYSAMFSFSGTSVDTHPVSAMADFTLDAGADTVTVKLTNTTELTNDAGELFTGIDFSIGGLTPSLTSDTGIQRTVDGSGNYVDTGSAQDLSWSLVSVGGGSYQLNFNPDAKDSIIGPPNGGNYAAANGSIKGNAGHNPFAAEMATFVLSVPNLESDTPVTATVFRFGTGLDPAMGTITRIPEPTTIATLMFSVSILGMGRRR